MPLLAENITTEQIFGILDDSGVKEATQFSTVSSILIFVFNVAFGIGVSITLITAAYGFVQYVLAMGEPKALKKAQDAVMWSLMGMGVMIGAWTFKQIVVRTLGADLPDEISF